MKRKHLQIVLLAIIAAGTWWFDFTQQAEFDKKPAQLSHKIDYFLKGAESVDMTTTGEPKQRFAADYIEHFIDDDTTEVIKPMLTMYSPTKPNIYLTSETAQVSSDAELISLNGAVHIQRDSQDNVAPIDVDTSNLRVQLPKDYAETDEFVTINSGFSSIQGNGLKVHFREPIKMKILNNVQGHHAIK